MITLTAEQQVEVRDCNPFGEISCYCDTGLLSVPTVCMYCWYPHPELRET